jgi:hypothetical protein
MNSDHFGEDFFGLSLLPSAPTVDCGISMMRIVDSLIG